MQLTDILGLLFIGAGALVAVWAVAEAVGWCRRAEETWRRETADYYNLLLADARRNVRRRVDISQNSCHDQSKRGAKLLDGPEPRRSAQ